MPGVLLSGQLCKKCSKISLLPIQGHDRVAESQSSQLHLVLQIHKCLVQMDCCLFISIPEIHWGECDWVQIISHNSVVNAIINGHPQWNPNALTKILNTQVYNSCALICTQQWGEQVVSDFLFSQHLFCCAKISVRLIPLGCVPNLSCSNGTGCSPWPGSQW